MTSWTTADPSTTSGTAWDSGFFYIRFGPPPMPRPVRTCAHKLLGLACDAPREEIRRAYRRLAKIAHPDAGGDGRWMTVVNRLYEIAAP